MELAQTVEADNKVFSQELELFQQEKAAKNTIDRFQQRNDKIKHYAELAKQNDKSIGIKLELVNFNMYLNRTMQSEALQRWVLVNQCFKESHPKHLSLIECKPIDPIYNKVRSIVGYQQI
jgi:arginine utilization protein RocB